MPITESLKFLREGLSLETVLSLIQSDAEKRITALITELVTTIDLIPSDFPILKKIHAHPLLSKDEKKPIFYICLKAGIVGPTLDMEIADSFHEPILQTIELLPLKHRTTENIETVISYMKWILKHELIYFTYALSQISEDKRFQTIRDVLPEITRILDGQRCAFLLLAMNNLGKEAFAARKGDILRAIH